MIEARIGECSRTSESGRFSRGMAHVDQINLAGRLVLNDQRNNCCCSSGNRDTSRNSSRNTSTFVRVSNIVMQLLKLLARDWVEPVLAARYDILNESFATNIQITNAAQSNLRIQEALGLIIGERVRGDARSAVGIHEPGVNVPDARQDFMIFPVDRTRSAPARSANRLGFGGSVQSRT
jgi:hypothetical protein